MIKKKIAILSGLLGIFVLLAACGTQPAIQWKTQTRSIEQVEEMISDELESENPDLEFNVTITDEIE